MTREARCETQAANRGSQHLPGSLKEAETNLDLCLFYIEPERHTPLELDCIAGKIKTKEERQEEAQKAQKEEQRKVTFKKYATETFMPRKAATFSQNSMEVYTRCLDKAFQYLGDLKMEEIKPLDITNFLLASQTKEKKLHYTGTSKGNVQIDEPLSHGSIIKYYTVLSGLFKMAYLDGVIENNPMGRVERPKPRKEEKIKEVHALSVEEVQRLLRYLDEEPFQWRTLIRLMLDTGARRGEITGLRWQSVNFEKGEIHIVNNLQYSKVKGVYENTVKGKTNRTVDVDPVVLGMLRELRDTQKVRTLKDYCFTQEDGQPIHPQSPTRYLERLSQRCGLPGLHPHALRHTAASIAITNGADVASVSAKLGHADKSTTLDMYTHADQESMKRANTVYRNAIYRQEA